MLRKAVADTILVWDTTTVPNGTYFVKVVASDAPSNPVGIALTGELESAAFEIDNTPPAITVARRRASSAAATIVTFDVKDDHSPIQRVEYSQDGSGGAACSRPTASPIRGRSTTSWRWRARWPSAG